MDLFGFWSLQLPLNSPESVQMRGPTLPGRAAACVAAYLLMIGAASGEYTRTACGTWADVRAECHALGGDLVVTRDPERGKECRDARLQAEL
jgi:hypothetical protein